MTRPSKEQLARREWRITRDLAAVGVLIAGFLLYATIVSLSTPRESRFGATLPNPMGGPAHTAPGDATGDIALGGLQVEGADVQMGEVALGVTYVPGWEITKPYRHRRDLPGRPAPGPRRLLPRTGLRRGPAHPGRPGTHRPARQPAAAPVPAADAPRHGRPHHLAVPLASGDEQTAVHVTGNFTDSARP